MTALLSNACLCNTKTLVRPDFVVEVRATLFIPKGEEVTKQYAGSLQTTNNRYEPRYPTLVGVLKETQDVPDVITYTHLHGILFGVFVNAS